MNNINYTFVSIATNQYSSYLKKLIMSAKKLDTTEIAVEWIIFTDSPNEFHNIIENDILSVKTIKIPSLGWPDATILRYKLFQKYSDLITGEIVVYLDADMEICEDFISKLSPEKWVNECALVAHPGYWRYSSNLAAMQFYVRHPSNLMKDLIILARMGSLGTWETRSFSSAFVPRNQRRNYVCGGTWMAKNHKFKEICEQLSTKVDYDSKRNVTAIWHDESHLNKWASENNHTLLLPSFCFDSSYGSIVNLPSYIRAVDKRCE